MPPEKAMLKRLGMDYNSMKRMALRAAADAGRLATDSGRDPERVPWPFFTFS